MYELITKELTTEQKLGLIPIVFEKDTKNKPKELLKKQKFEFDLFSLEPDVYKKLEDYVKQCIEKNKLEK